jgi:hypothetical protein
MVMEQQSLVLGCFRRPDQASAALGALRAAGFGEVDIEASRDAAAPALQVRAGARSRAAEDILARHGAWLRVTQLTSPFEGELDMSRFTLPVVPVSEADWLDQHTPAIIELEETSDPIQGTAQQLKQAVPPGDEADLLDEWTAARRQMRD